MDPDAQRDNPAGSVSDSRGCAALSDVFPQSEMKNWTNTGEFPLASDDPLVDDEDRHIATLLQKAHSSCVMTSQLDYTGLPNPTSDRNPLGKCDTYRGEASDFFIDGDPYRGINAHSFKQRVLAPDEREGNWKANNGNENVWPEIAGFNCGSFVPFGCVSTVGTFEWKRDIDSSASEGIIHVLSTAPRVFDATLQR